MRNTFRIVIITCFVFFAIGWIAVLVGWVTTNAYLTVASLIGTFASVMGLLAFSRPSISRNDLKELEIDNLTRLAESSATLEALESKKIKTETDIAELTRTREEMDGLVKKAATSLFIREELKRIQDKIDAHVTAHPDLLSDLRTYEEQRDRLRALNEEMQAHKDAALLADIIRRVRIRPERQIATYYDTLDKIWLIGPLMKMYLQISMLKRDRNRVHEALIADREYRKTKMEKAAAAKSPDDGKAEPAAGGYSPEDGRNTSA